MSWTILISFDPNRGICAIIGIAQAEDAAKQDEIKFDKSVGKLTYVPYYNMGFIGAI